MPKKILVTGTGRSGTTFVASTLANLGISATHEHIYQVGGGKAGWPACDHVEVSWAAPRFRSEWPENMTILHLVRNPLRVIESYLNVTHSVPAYMKGHWRLPELLPPKGNVNPENNAFWQPKDFVAWHYITWNRLVERYAQTRHQVEKDMDLLVWNVNGACTADIPDTTEAQKKANRNSVNAGRNKVMLAGFHKELRGPLECIIKDYGYEC